MYLGESEQNLEVLVVARARINLLGVQVCFVQVFCTKDISYGLLNRVCCKEYGHYYVVALFSRKKKVHTNTIFFIFVLSEDTGRLSGLRGSDNESEEE